MQNQFELVGKAIEPQPTGDIKTQGASFSNGGLQNLHFLMAKQTMFSTVGIESSHRQSGPGQAQRLQGVGAALQIIQNSFTSDQFDGFSEGNMPAQEEDFQVKHLE